MARQEAGAIKCLAALLKHYLSITKQTVIISNETKRMFYPADIFSLRKVLGQELKVQDTTLSPLNASQHEEGETAKVLTERTVFTGGDDAVSPDAII